MRHGKESTYNRHHEEVKIEEETIQNKESEVQQVNSAKNFIMNI